MSDNPEKPTKERPDQYDAYDVALLAAQLRRGTHEATEAALGLLEEAESKLSQIDAREKLITACHQADAEAPVQEEKRLADLKLNYQQGVEIITGHEGKGHWDRTKVWFEKFLAAKAKKEQASETWVEVKLGQYRVKGFTGTEANKLRKEFIDWRAYRGQGRVKKKTDGRLKKNKRGRPRTTVEVDYHETIDVAEAEQIKERAGKPSRQPSENQFWKSDEARRTAAEKRSAQTLKAVPA